MARGDNPKSKQESEDDEGAPGCRCSPSALTDVMEVVKPLMTARHFAALAKNPFQHYLRMPKLCHSFPRVAALMKAYNVEDRSFHFGHNRVEFNCKELCIVLGLQYNGIPVDVNLNVKSHFIQRVFQGKLTAVTRNRIAIELKKYAVKTDRESVDDFCRLFTIYIFNTILIPKGNKTLPRFVYPHIDDLERLECFSWGQLVFDILLENMEQMVTRESRYFEGCTIGLLAWVHERITSLGYATSVYEFPRFFRWRDSKIPADEREAAELFSQIAEKQVIQFFLHKEEKRLLLPILEEISGPVHVESSPPRVDDTKTVHSVPQGGEEETEDHEETHQLHSGEAVPVFGNPKPKKKRKIARVIGGIFGDPRKNILKKMRQELEKMKKGGEGERRKKKKKKREKGEKRKKGGEGERRKKEKETM